MNSGFLPLLTMGALFGAGLGYGEGRGWRGEGRKPRWKRDNAQSRTAKARNRKNGKLARKNRRLNLRKGKVAGNQ